MKNIMDIIIENLTNERLDRIVDQDEDLCMIESQLHEALSHYDTLEISKQDMKAINGIFDIYNAHGARYAALAYRQGLIDSIELLKGLKLI